MCFLKLTADQLLVYRLDRGLKSRYFSGKEGRITRKGKISARINPWRVVDFSSDLLLVFSVTQFKIVQNKNQNRSIDKVQNLGDERR